MSSVRPIQQLSNNQHGRAQSDLVQFGSPVPLAGYSSHLQQIAPFATPRGDQSSRNILDEDQQRKILNSNQGLGYPNITQQHGNVIEQGQSYRNEQPSSRSNTKELNGNDIQRNYLSNSSLIGLLPSTTSKITTPPQSDIAFGSNGKYYKGCHDINPSSYGTKNAYQTAPCSPQNSQQQDQEQHLLHKHQMQHLDQQQGRVQEKQIQNEGDQYGVHFSLTTTQGHNSSLTGNTRIPSLIVNEGMATKQGLLFDEQRELTFKGLEDSKIISQQKYQENVPNNNRNQISQAQLQQQSVIQGQKQNKAGLEMQQEEMNIQQERTQSDQKQKVQLMEYYNQLQPSSEREDRMFPPLQQLDSNSITKQYGDYKSKETSGGSLIKGDYLQNQYAHQLEVIQQQYEGNSYYQNNQENEKTKQQQQVTLPLSAPSYQLAHTNNCANDNTPKFRKEQNHSINVNNNQIQSSFQQSLTHQQDNTGINTQQVHSEFSQQILEDLIHQPANNQSVHSQAIHVKERSFSHLAEPLNSNSTKKVQQQGTTITPTNTLFDISKLDNMMHKQSPNYTNYLNQFDRNTGSTLGVLTHQRNKSAISPNTIRTTMNGQNNIINSSFGNTSNIHHNTSKSSVIDPVAIIEDEGSLEKLNEIHQAVHNQLAQILPLDASYSSGSPANAAEFQIAHPNNSDAPCSFGPSSQHPQKPQVTPNQSSQSSQSSSTFLAQFEPLKRSPENSNSKGYVNCSEVKDQNNNLSYIHDRITESRQTILQNALQSIKPSCVDSNTKNITSQHMKIEQGMTMPAQALLQHYQDSKRNKGNNNSSSNHSLNASPVSSYLKLRSPKEIKAGIITQQTTPRTLKKWTEILQPQEQLQNGYLRNDSSFSNQQKQQLLSQKDKQENNNIHGKSLSKPFNSIDDQINQLNIGDITKVVVNNVNNDNGNDDNDHNSHNPHAPSFTDNSQYSNSNRDRLEMLLKKAPTSLIPSEKSQQQLDASYYSTHSNTNNNNNLRQNSFILKQQAFPEDIRKIDKSLSKDDKQTKNFRNISNNNSNRNKINSNNDTRINNSSFIGQQSQQSSFISVQKDHTNGILSNTSPRLREVYADLDDSRIQEKISSIKAQLSTMARHNAQLLQQDSQILGDYSLDKFKTTAGSVSAIIGARSQSPFEKNHSIASRKQKEQLNTSNNLINSSKLHLNSNKSIKNLSNASNTPASKLNNNITTHKRAVSALNDSLLVNTPPFSITLNTNTAKDNNPSNILVSKNNINIQEVNGYQIQGTSIQQVVALQPINEMQEQYQSQQLNKLKISAEADTARSNTPGKNNRTNEQSYLVGNGYNNGILPSQSTVTNSPAGFDVVRFESKSDLGQSPPNSNVITKFNSQINTANNQQVLQQEYQQQNPLIKAITSNRQRAVSSISGGPVIDHNNIPVSSTIPNSSKQSAKQSQRLGSPGQQTSPSGSAYFLSKRAYNNNKTTGTSPTAGASAAATYKLQLGANALKQMNDQSQSSFTNNSSIISAPVILDPANLTSKIPLTLVKTPRKEGYSVNPFGRTNQDNNISSNLNKSNSSRSLTPTNRQKKNSQILTPTAIDASRSPSSGTYQKKLSNVSENNQLTADPIYRLNKGEPVSQQKMSEKELREYSKKKYENLPDVKKMREQQQHQAQKINYHKQRSEKIKQFDEMCRAKNKPSSASNS